MSNKNQNKKEKLERRFNFWDKAFSWYHRNSKYLVNALASYSISFAMTQIANINPFLPEKPEIMQKVDNYNSKTENLKNNKSDLKEKLNEDTTYFVTPEEVKDSLYKEKHENYVNNLENRLFLYNKGIDYYKNQIQEIKSSEKYKLQKKKYNQKREEFSKNWLITPSRIFAGYFALSLLSLLGFYGMKNHYKKKLKKYNQKYEE